MSDHDAYRKFTGKNDVHDAVSDQQRNKMVRG